MQNEFFKITVAELIAKLQKCNPEHIVTIWDNYYDCLNRAVKVSTNNFNEVHIGKTVFGKEIN